ncbi:alpha/beta fold hydrolase [Streptomyces sp. NPDC007917]|uniref:alpha/beta fold hydrolase n=1 Tax=Streptomyces sp. NPDC007917 TaxID=3364793 RepID=UPI0036EB352F
MTSGRRVITSYQRGFGRSSQPVTGYDYDAFAAGLDKLPSALGLTNVDLAGHLMGGGEIARYLAVGGRRPGHATADHRTADRAGLRRRRPAPERGSGTGRQTRAVTVDPVTAFRAAFRGMGGLPSWAAGPGSLKSPPGGNIPARRDLDARPAPAPVRARARQHPAGANRSWPNRPGRRS